MLSGGSVPKIQIPLAKGLVKEAKTADYIDALLVNLLATPKEVLNASGYYALSLALRKSRT
ncbi:hypothetical protein ARAF_0701 [Arsenophonus endosymbiont of Aleurodicus floccissimus]|nr:hypothetical protein ARAF_0701 [Arsenophonus endosymbiont of Aleurodicus floccissimus]